MDLGIIESMEATSKRIQRERLLEDLLAELKQNKPERQITPTGLAIINRWLKIDFNELTLALLIQQEEKTWITLLFALFEAGVGGDMIHKFLENPSTPINFKDSCVLQIDGLAIKTIVRN
ncbi:MAG: hypothetical protein Q7R72_00785 [bacterium]|nr:hypothetical protein [bacterium]